VIRLLAIAVLMFLSGCVHLDEYIEINGDGSAKLVFTYSVPKSTSDLLNDSESVLQDLNNNFLGRTVPRIFDEKSMREYLSTFKGVEIVSIRVNEEDYRINAYIHLRVENLRQSLRDGLLPYTSLEKSGKDYVFASLLPFDLTKLKKSDSLYHMTKDMKVSFKVKTPSEITGTDAPKQLANYAEWNYSPEGSSFSKCNGRFSVKFSAQNLTFLDEKKEK
jgi:hypothetical protein